MEYCRAVEVINNEDTIINAIKSRTHVTLENIFSIDFKEKDA